MWHQISWEKNMKKEKNSEDQKNPIAEIYNWFKLQIDQKNYFLLILITLAMFWGYGNIFIPIINKLENIFTIGISNATANSIVEADVRALMEKIAELESKVNADFNARRTGVLGETHH